MIADQSAVFVQRLGVEDDRGGSLIGGVVGECDQSDLRAEEREGGGSFVHRFDQGCARLRIMRKPVAGVGDLEAGDGLADAGGSGTPMVAFGHGIKGKGSFFDRRGNIYFLIFYKFYV